MTTTIDQLSPTWDALRRGDDVSPADFAEASRLWDALRDQAAPPAPHLRTIYYFQRTDGAIKIGSTKGRIADRSDELRRVYGPGDILAQERGPAGFEQERHRQFVADQLPPDPRPGGTEWFRPGADLVRHIEALRTAVAA